MCCFVKPGAPGYELLVKLCENKPLLILTEFYKPDSLTYIPNSLSYAASQPGLVKMALYVQCTSTIFGLSHKKSSMIKIFMWMSQFIVVMKPYRV